MSATPSPARGQPLVALVGIIAAWIVVRVLLLHYDALLASPAIAWQHGRDPLTAHVVNGGGNSGHRQIRSQREQGDGAPLPSSAALLAPRPAVRFRPMPRMADPTLHDRSAGAARVQPLAPTVAAGHQMLWMAALSRVPLPDGFGMAAALPAPAPFYPAGREPVSREKRWSADGWVMLRRGGASGLATGSAPATYGASQAGAVVRYRLDPSSGHRPAAYLRVTSALDGPAEHDAAVGLSARPLVKLPVVAAVELRATQQSGHAHLRPAAMIVTQIRPIDLPHATRAEFYGQAGYVGGSFATAFADGQALVHTRVADLGPAQVRAGAGAWAGAQKGASRIDVGPSANLGMPLGHGASARIGFDWRIRISGNAQPGSGPAFTLSAGF